MLGRRLSVWVQALTREKTRIAQDNTRETTVSPCVLWVRRMSVSLPAGYAHWERKAEFGLCDTTRREVNSRCAGRDVRKSGFSGCVRKKRKMVVGW